MGVVRSVRHNLTHLLYFAGQDKRAIFWPYAVIVAITTVFVLQLVATWSIRQLVDRVPPTATHDIGLLFAQLGDVAMAMLLPMSGVLALAWLLLAAAMARRLRDRGVTPWLVLVPVVLFACGLLATMALGDPMLGVVQTGTFPGAAAAPWGILFALSGVLNLGYNVSLIVLIVLLAQQSRPLAVPTSTPS